MPDNAARLARTILSRNLGLKKGNSVVIESWTHSLPYTRAFVDEARRLGAQPTVLYEDETAWWNAVAAKRTGPFSHLSSAEKAAVGNADAYLYFWGPADMRRAIDLGTFSSKFIGFNEEWYAAARKSGLRGYRMSLGLASDATAKRFGLAGPAWRERLVKAGAVDAGKMLATGNRVAKRISGGSELRIRHSNGTDLRIAVHGARMTVAGGIPSGATKGRPRGMLEGNPSGQLFAALDGKDASGTFVSNRTVFDMGRYDKYAGSKWSFKDGRLTDHSTTVGRGLFEKAFGAAPKGTSIYQSFEGPRPESATEPTLDFRPSRGQLGGRSTSVGAVRDHELVAVRISDDCSNKASDRGFDDLRLCRNGSATPRDLSTGPYGIRAPENNPGYRAGVSALLAGSLGVHREQSRGAREREDEAACLHVEKQLLQPQYIPVECSGFLGILDVDRYGVKPGYDLAHEGPSVPDGLILANRAGGPSARP